MNIPNIRFKGFNGEWEKKKLGEVAPLKGGYAFNSANFKDSGIPIVRISNILESEEVGGEFVFYDKIKNENQFLLRYEDIVIAMSGATTGKIALVKTKNKLYQNQRVGKFSRTSNVDYKYLSALVSSSNFSSELNKLLSSSAQPNASSSDIDSIKLYFPSCKQEQSLLGSFLERINNIIVTTNLKLAFFKQIKAASQQSMFPQEGETVSKVRFKGFEGEWEKIQLNNCLNISNNINIHNTYGINDVLSISDEVGVVNQIEFLGRSFAGKSLQKYKILKTDQLVYTKSPLKAKPYGIIKNNSNRTGIVSTLYAIYDCKDNVSPEFIHYYFDPCYRINQYLSPLVNKGAKNTMNISDETALSGEIWIPSLQEQQKIASYFCNLDKQISLQTQHLEKLKQIKAACLDKMFV